MTRAVVRRADQGDAESIYRLLLVMHEENGLAPLDPAKTYRTIIWLLKRGILIVAGKGGEIIGSVGLFETQPWYSQASRLEDRWVFVHPDHRRSRVIFDLIKAARKAADEKGLPLYLGITSIHDLDRKRALYTRLGLQEVGSLFMKGR